MYEEEEKRRSEIRSGDIVVLKTKFHTYYRDKFNPKFVDITKPAKVIKTSSGKIYLEGWDEIHKLKEGRGFPIDSFQKMSNRQVKLHGICKQEPIHLKMDGIIKDINETTVSILLNDGSTMIFPFILVSEIPNDVNSKVTIISNSIAGRQVIEVLKFKEVTEKKDAEKKKWGKEELLKIIKNRKKSYVDDIYEDFDDNLEIKKIIGYNGEIDIENL
jgi:hypothetical protein